MATSKSDLEGFIYGTISCHKTHPLEDEKTEEKEKLIIGIQDFRFVGSVCGFYDGVGKVQLSPQKLVEGTEQELLGWFRYRPNTSLRPSLREISVHSQLEKLRPKSVKRSKVPLLFGLFTQTWSASNATHSFDYRFVHMGSETISPVELNITNLVHSSQKEYDDFIPLSVGIPLNYNQLCGQMPLYTKELESFIEKQLEQLKAISNELDSSTREIRALEEEIHNLSRD